MPVLASLLLLLNTAGLVPAPHTLASRNAQATAPIWVSADAATDERGRLRRDVFEARYYDALQRYAIGAAERRAVTNATEPENDCATYVGERPIEWSDEKIAGDFRDLVRFANAIYAGTITTITPGFFDGQPASLLGVNVTESVKGAAAYKTTGGLYVPYAAANFRIGGQQFCAQPLYQNYTPQVGDRIVVYALHAPADPDGKLIHADSRDLIFESSTKTLAVARDFRKELDVREWRSLGDVVQRTRNLMHDFETPRK